MLTEYVPGGADCHAVGNKILEIAFREAGFRVNNLGVMVAQAEFIAAAHANGLMVVPWTINDESTMREQIEAGVDGIITDYPSRLAAVLDELGIGY